MTSSQGGIIPLKLKRILTDKRHHIHQNIRPYSVYRGLSWLRRNNTRYKNVQINKNWETNCQEEDEDLWHILQIEENDDQNDTIDSEDIDIPEEESTKKYDDSVESQVQGLHFDTCLPPSNIVHTGVESYRVASGERKIPAMFANEICEALAFPVCFPYGKGTFLDIRNYPRNQTVKYC